MLFDVIMVLLIIVGIVLIIFACVSKNKDKLDDKSDYFEANSAVQLVKQAIDDADNAIEQLNKISSSVFDEFEGKYQELLFLYQMIDDMKEKRDKFDFTTSIESDDRNSEKKQVSFSKASSFKNPNFDKIKNMQEQGLSISEISKALNMGQGEVKLILELGKAR